jgi:hypothetical protein
MRRAFHRRLGVAPAAYRERFTTGRRARSTASRAGSESRALRPSQREDTHADRHPPVRPADRARRRRAV